MLSLCKEDAFVNGHITLTFMSITEFFYVVQWPSIDFYCISLF